MTSGGTAFPLENVGLDQLPRAKALTAMHLNFVSALLVQQSVPVPPPQLACSARWASARLSSPCMAAPDEESEPVVFTDEGLSRALSSRLSIQSLLMQRSVQTQIQYS